MARHLCVFVFACVCLYLRVCVCIWVCLRLRAGQEAGTYFSMVRT